MLKRLHGCRRLEASEALRMAVLVVTIYPQTLTFPTWLTALPLSSDLTTESCPCSAICLAGVRERAYGSQTQTLAKGFSMVDYQRIELANSCAVV